MAQEEKRFLGELGLPQLIELIKSNFANFANILHTHTKSDITDLEVDTTLSSTSENLVQNMAVSTAIDELNNKFGNYLPLTGGTLTGTLKTSGNIFKSVDDSLLGLNGGTSSTSGAFLALLGKDYSSKYESGSFRLVAHNGTDSQTLMGTPTGELTWGGNAIPTSADLNNYLPLAGGTLTGDGIWMANGLGRVRSTSSATYVIHHASEKDGDNSTYLSIANGNNVVNMIRATRVVEGETSAYSLYGTHNITASTSALTAGTSSLTTGCIHLTYS